MSAIITGFLGIVMLLASLFFAFGLGVETQRGNVHTRTMPFCASLGCAVIAVGLLLVRS